MHFCPSKETIVYFVALIFSVILSVYTKSLNLSFDLSLVLIEVGDLCAEHVCWSNTLLTRLIMQAFTL